jgi:hypothetical protein
MKAGLTVADAIDRVRDLFANPRVTVADRPHLLRRFYRASTAHDRRIPDTGLGLVITPRHYRKHGGTITGRLTFGPSWGEAGWRR